MKDVFRIFFSTGWRQQVLILLALLMAGMVEAIGIATLWPIVGLVGGTTGTKVHAIDLYIRQGLDFLGLPLTIETLLLIILGASVFKFILSTIGSVFVGRCVADFGSNIRLQIIDALVRARWSYFVAQPVARFTAAIGMDVDRAALAFRASAMCLATLIQGGALMTMALFVSWPFFLGTLAMVVVLWLTVGRYMRIAKKAGRGKSKHNLALLKAVTDALTNVKALKAMNRHTFIGHTFANHVERLRRAMQAETYSTSAMRAVQDPLLTIFLLVGIYFTHTLAGMDLQILLGSVLLLKRTGEVMAQVRANYQRVVVDRVSYWAVLALLEEIVAEREPIAKGALPPTLADLHFRDVDFSYPGKEVVKNAVLDIGAGSLTTIIGPSGAGKTTIGDLVARLQEPSEGEILIGDQKLSSLDLAAWRRQLGYIPQESILFNDTILNNVTLGDSRITEAQAITALKAAGAWQFVSVLPGTIHFIVGVRGSLLSGGQRQRLSIARALVGNPRMLILDEATSALDDNTAREINNSMRMLAGKRTILAITHQSLWVDGADQVYEIRAGKVTTAPVGTAAV